MMPEAFRLDGKVALITGAAGGIGMVTAALFEQAGARLVLTDRAGHGEALRGRFRQACVLEADLGDAAAIDSVARSALAAFGRIEVLVCNAGMQGPAGPMAQADAAAIDSVIAVNLRGPMALCNAIAPGMAAAEGGSIVLISSIAGVRGNKAIGVYGITKAAIAQLARNLAVEWGPHAVRANAVSPGLIRTAFAQAMIDDPQIMDRRLSLTPMRRCGEADEVASAILFLASPAGGFVTGHNLIVDGGTTISDGN